MSLSIHQKIYHKKQKVLMGGPVDVSLLLRNKILGFLCFFSLLLLLQAPLGDTQRKESLELCEFSVHTLSFP